MKKNNIWRRTVSFAAAFACLMNMGAVSVKADTIEQLENEKNSVQQQKEEAEQELGEIQDNIDSISEEKSSAEEELEELDNTLVDLLLEVELMKSDIEDKKAAIEEAQAAYDAALEQEKEQQDAMNKRIKFMYEKGDESYLEIMLESKSMAEAVNKVDYTEKLYAYDRQLLEQYQLAKQDVADKKAELEEELNDLEEMEKDLESQQQELNSLIAEKQETVEGFAEQLANAQSQANEYEQQIKKQSEELKRINKEQQEKIAEEAKKKAEEEAKKKAAEAAKKKLEEDAKKNAAQSGEKLEAASSGDGTTTATDGTTTATDGTAATGDSESGSGSGTTTTASGSGLGAEIANYGLQFVGNPYVAGGTSLTNGADCSGFTQSVYAHFGISIPRSSYAQSQSGTEIPVADMQAGDILYYGGHVAIYIGNGKIVHASTEASGIKIGNAYYRSVITVRRYY